MMLKQLKFVEDKANKRCRRWANNHAICTIWTRKRAKNSNQKTANSKKNANKKLKQNVFFLFSCSDEERFRFMQFNGNKKTHTRKICVYLLIACRPISNRKTSQHNKHTSANVTILKRTARPSTRTNEWSVFDDAEWPRKRHEWLDCVILRVAFYFPKSIEAMTAKERRKLELNLNEVKMKNEFKFSLD